MLLALSREVVVALCPIPLLRVEPLGRGGMHGSRCREDSGRHRSADSAEIARGVPRTSWRTANQEQHEVRARCLALASRLRPSGDAPSSAEAVLFKWCWSTVLVAVPQGQDDVPEHVEVLPVSRG